MHGPLIKLERVPLVRTVTPIDQSSLKDRVLFPVPGISRKAAFPWRYCRASTNGGSEPTGDQIAVVVLARAWRGVTPEPGLTRKRRLVLVFWAAGVLDAASKRVEVRTGRNVDSTSSGSPPTG